MQDGFWVQSSFNPTCSNPTLVYNVVSRFCPIHSAARGSLVMHGGKSGSYFLINNECALSSSCISLAVDYLFRSFDSLLFPSLLTSQGTHNSPSWREISRDLHGSFLCFSSKNPWSSLLWWIWQTTKVLNLYRVSSSKAVSFFPWMILKGEMLSDWSRFHCYIRGLKKERIKFIGTKVSRGEGKRKKPPLERGIRTFQKSKNSQRDILKIFS